MRAERHAMFQSVGQRLLNELRGAAAARTDTQIQGRAGENAFLTWLRDQLPNRFEVRKGAVLSPQAGPTNEMDCLLVDADQSPAFRRAGGEPDLFPIEGIIACIEINTGPSGASYGKLLDDAKKLSEVGKLAGTGRRPDPRPAKLLPLPTHLGNTIQGELWVHRQHFLIPPLLLIFAETLRGNLGELTSRLAAHNKRVGVKASVDGAFILNEGFILHMTPGQVWDVHRMAGSQLAWMQAEPWHVLLKLMTIIWNYLWKGPCEFGPEMSDYYADQAYFVEVEEPHIKVLDDIDYQSQTADPDIVAFIKPP